MFRVQWRTQNRGFLVGFVQKGHIFVQFRTDKTACLDPDFGVLYKTLRDLYIFRAP